MKVFQRGQGSSTGRLNEIRAIDSLTGNLIQRYIDRKSPGRLDVVVDVDSEKYYLVQKDVEHKDFIPQLPHKRDSAMVPFWMRLQKNDDRYFLQELVTGASSYEADRGVRHSKRELVGARNLAWLLILLSPDISYGSLERDKILWNYCNRQS